MLGENTFLEVLTHLRMHRRTIFFLGVETTLACSIFTHHPTIQSVNLTTVVPFNHISLSRPILISFHLLCVLQFLLYLDYPPINVPTACSNASIISIRGLSVTRNTYTSCTSPVRLPASGPRCQSGCSIQSTSVNIQSTYSQHTVNTTVNMPRSIVNIRDSLT